MNEELNDNKIFEFDHEDYVKKCRKAIILFMSFLPIMMILIFIFDQKTISFQFNIVESKPMLSIFILIELMLMFYAIFARKFTPEKISLEINSNSFTLRNDKLSETIPFSKINEIEVYKNKKGVPVLFIVKTGKTHYYILSLKEMARLLEWFEENKINNLNWNLSFHKKSLFDTKCSVYFGLFFGAYLSLLNYFRIYGFENLLNGIIFIIIGLISFIIKKRNISYLKNQKSIFRWVWFVYGIFLILTTIF